MLNAPLSHRGERLSALADNELSDVALDETVDTLSRDPQSRATFERYEMVGHVLRAEMPDFTMPDLSRRIMARIDAEAERDPEVEQSPNVVSMAAARRRWQLPAGVAVAASILVATFVLVPVMQQEGESPVGVESMQAAATPAAQLREPATMAVAASRESVPVWATSGRPTASAGQPGMDPYVMTHFEQASSSAQFGSVMPGARLANYQTR